MFFDKFSFSFKYLAIIAIIISPSIRFPFSSTAKHLSPSPSYANPMFNLFSTTYFCKNSICVDPHLSFIFIPFGLLFIILYLIPNDVNIFSATLYVAPLSVSKPIIKPSLFILSIFVSKFFLKKYTYSSIKSSQFSYTPILSLTAVSSSILPDSITSSISSSKLSGIFIPLLLKNLIPLNSNVLCEADITTLASAFNFLVKYATAGVGITPNNFTFAP